jgi:hypothetical protein
LDSSAAQNIQILDTFPFPQTGRREDWVLMLFGETNGCLLVEVRAGDRTAFETQMAGTDFYRLGTVTVEPVLSIGSEDERLIKLPVEDLVRAWGGSL